MNDNNMIERYAASMMSLDPSENLFKSMFPVLEAMINDRNRRLDEREEYDEQGIIENQWDAVVDPVFQVRLPFKEVTPHKDYYIDVVSMVSENEAPRHFAVLRFAQTGVVCDAVSIELIGKWDNLNIVEQVRHRPRHEEPQLSWVAYFLDPMHTMSVLNLGTEWSLEPDFIDGEPNI